MAAILVVDDDPLVLKRTETLLLRKGYRVLSASNGEKALEIARSDSAIDAAIVDYHMPGLNGLEVMMELRALLPECRRILLSGAIDVAVVMDAVNRCSVSQVLQKPFVAKDLLAAIEDAIASKPAAPLSPVSPSPSPQSVDPVGPGAEIAEYVIGQVLGRGGMATVYGAVHPVIDRRAAIKVLNPGVTEVGLVQERFIREAQAVNRIRHPNIVDIFSTGTLPDGRLYLVMEWIEGETLHACMEKKPLRVLEILSVLDQLCAAVHAAHEKGVIHRDIKPQNVMLCWEGLQVKVKLLDFGIAKLDDAVSHSTRPGAILGTPHYLSPEQIGGGEVTRASDVYSIGVLAFELFTGGLPFHGESLTSLALQHLMSDAPSARALWDAVPEELDAMLLRLMAKDPRARPALPEVRALVERLALEPFAEETPPRRCPAMLEETRETMDD